ncbi:hypothetical protein BJ912DRAFT_1069888 [Pholiota molesta]|nr:hypothetical protein BJ912DRAFT_1069888 [Pholiota molesta]
MALGMLQESPVDEEDGSPCRRASNLIRDIVINLILPCLLVRLFLVVVVVRIVLGLLSASSPSSSSRLDARRNGAIGSHDIRGEVEASLKTSRLMDTPSWKGTLTMRVNSPAGVSGVVQRTLAMETVVVLLSTNINFVTYLATWLESGGNVVSGGTQRDG